MSTTFKRCLPVLLVILTVAGVSAVLFASPQHASADVAADALVVAQGDPEEGEGEGGEEKTDPLEGKTAPSTVKTKTINKQPVKNGTYIIEPVAARNNLVGAANKAGGAKMRVASEWSFSNLYKWKFNYNYSKKAYTIVNVGSKKALTLSGKRVVQKKLKKKKTNKRQLWCVVATNTGYKIYSRQNKKYVFTLSGASIVTAKNNNGSAQRYGITPVTGWSKGAIIKPGTYALYNYGTGKVLQLKYNSFRNGTALNLAGDLGVLNQKFDLARAGGNTYYITSASTDKAVAYTSNGLVISSSAGTLARQWTMTKKDNGGFIIGNGGHAGQVLRGAVDGSVKLVTSTEDEYTAEDYWAIIPTSCGLTAYQRLGLQKANTKLSPASKTNYYISIDKTAHFLMIFDRDDGDSEWEIMKTWRCSTVMHKHKYDKNKDHYTSGHKWLVHDELRDDGYCYRAKYWTHLGWGVAIHSILFKYQSNSVKDGRIGYSISGGCTRLPVSRAKWVHDNIPGGTGTSIYYK